MRVYSTAALVLAFALIDANANAQSTTQTVRITLGPDAQQLADRMMLSTAQLETLMTEQVQGLFSLVDPSTFLRLSSNAQSMANKGIAADYSASIDRFVVGFGINLALSAGDTDIESLMKTALGEFDRAAPIAGGIQLSLMLGLKITDGLFVYVNGLAYPVSVEQFKGSGYNVGAHLQYRLGSGAGAKVLAEWGGLAFTTGIELSRSSMKLEDKIDAPVPIASDFQLDTSSMGSAELVQEALTIPFEITTSLRLLYFISVYGGVGADVQLGKATALFNLDSSLSAVTNGATFDNVGSAHIEYTGENDADKFIFRVLAGLGVNVGPIQAFSQLNLYTRDLTIGMALGLRLAF